MNEASSASERETSGAHEREPSASTSRQSVDPSEREPSGMHARETISTDEHEPPSSSEEALESFLECRRRGEAVDPTDFALRHADLGPELAQALGALSALERATQDPKADELPERIGAFRVVREIGRGGMGVVLEAIEEPLGRRVALKVVPPELLQSGSARARFRREAELAARLDHPGIATIYGAGVEADRPWIAMRFIEGRTLARAIAEARLVRTGSELSGTTADAHGRGAGDRSDGRRPGDARDARARVASVRDPEAENPPALGRAISGRAADGRAVRCAQLGPTLLEGREAALALAGCLAQVARALQAAHEQGVVHRDVKPSNVIVGWDGKPVLVDFGLAIDEEYDGHTLTRTGDTAGTPAYLAPENVSGERARPDAQSDVYALGVTLYECLALRRPFDAPTPAALYRAIVSGATPDLRATNRAVPRDLAVVVATALERDRARRYRSAAALAEDLEACVVGRPIAARPLPLHGRLLRWARREPRQAVLAGLLMLATLGTASFGGTWWASRDKVHAAEISARARELESALGDGFERLSSDALDEAEAAFQRALSLDSRCIEAHVGRVLLSLDSQALAKTRARLAQVPPDTRGIDALEALVERRPLAPPRAGPELEGVSPLELFIRGLCWQYQANRTPLSERAPLHQQALACFTEAVLRAPIARPHYHEHRALAAQVAGNQPSARSAAAALLSLWPDSPRALYAAGRALYAIDPPVARRHLERAIELRPLSLPPYNLIAMACCEQRDFEAAESWGWRALALDPRNANMHFWVAQSLTLRECHTEASSAYRRAALLDPTHAGMWAQLAVTDLVNEDPARAVESYEHSLAIDPQAHRVRIFFAAALELAGDAERAQSELDTAIAGLYPTEVGYWRMAVAMFGYMHANRTSLTAAEVGLMVAPQDAELGRLRREAFDALEAPQ